MLTLFIAIAVLQQPQPQPVPAPVPAWQKKITNPRLKRIDLIAPPPLDPSPRPIIWFEKDGRINWDAEKQQRRIVTDTIVIHHTAMQPGLQPDVLSALELKRLYKPQYATETDDPDLRGHPVDSSHDRIINGQKVPVYYPYHAIVRDDGTVVPLLHEGEVGWHCGSWSTNNRSMAIVFDGDMQQHPPSDKALEAAAKLIAEWVQRYPIRYFCGHRDVTNTICPGPWLTDDAKRDLLWRAQRYLR